MRASLSRLPLGAARTAARARPAGHRGRQRERGHQAGGQHQRGQRARPCGGVDGGVGEPQRVAAEAERLAAAVAAVRDRRLVGRHVGVVERSAARLGIGLQAEVAIVGGGQLEQPRGVQRREQEAGQRASPCLQVERLRIGIDRQVERQRGRRGIRVAGGGMHGQRDLAAVGGAAQRVGIGGGQVGRLAVGDRGEQGDGSRGRGRRHDGSGRGCRRAEHRRRPRRIGGRAGKDGCRALGRGRHDRGSRPLPGRGRIEPRIAEPAQRRAGVGEIEAGDVGAPGVRRDAGRELQQAACAVQHRAAGQQLAMQVGGDIAGAPREARADGILPGLADEPGQRGGQRRAHHEGAKAHAGRAGQLDGQARARAGAGRAGRRAGRAAIGHDVIGVSRAASRIRAPTAARVHRTARRGDERSFFSM